MRILAIDPGPTICAWVDFDVNHNRPLYFGMCCGDDLLKIIAIDDWRYLVVEMVQHYGHGMPVGKEVFDTVMWIGEFRHACKVIHGTLVDYWATLSRPCIKGHLCGSAAARDSNIRAALLDRFGPGKEKAVGTKKAPGPLYGIKKDLWSALAVAVTYADLNKLRLESVTP